MSTMRLLLDCSHETHVSSKRTVQDVVGKEERVGHRDRDISHGQTQVVDLFQPRHSRSAKSPPGIYKTTAR